MLFMIEKLSRKPKSQDMVTRTEGKDSRICQGQSIGSEPVIQNIIYPRVLNISFRDEKVCRYSIEKWRCKIKNLLQRMGTGDESATIFNRNGVYFAQQVAPRVQSAYIIMGIA